MISLSIPSKMRGVVFIGRIYGRVVVDADMSFEFYREARDRDLQWFYIVAKTRIYGKN